MARYDAVLVAGGGVREGGVLPPWVMARFDRALQVHEGAFLIPLSCGTVYRPPVLENGIHLTEAAAGARYLLQRNFDPKKILLEACSYDTIGNAYFSRVIHVIPRKFRSVLVITSRFHMPRTQEIFKWVYSLDGPGTECSVAFEATENVGVEPDALQARLAKEDTSLSQLQSIQSRVTSLAALNQWLFTEHGAYASTLQPPRIGIDTRTY